MGSKLWTKDYIIFCLSSLVMFFAFYSLISALPVYLHDELLARNWEVGFVLSAYALAAVLLRPFCGYALDAWGRKWVFMSGFLVFCLLFGSYLLPSFFEGSERKLFENSFLAPVGGISLGLMILVGVRFLHGLSWEIVTSGSQTITVDLVPVSRRGEGLAYSGLMVSLAMAVGPAFGLWLLEITSGAELFVITLVLSLLSFTAVCFMKFPVYRATRSRINLKAMVEKTSIPISLVCLICCFSNASTMTFVAIYCKDMQGCSAGVFFFITALSTTMIRLFTGKAFDRYGPKIPMTTAFPCLILGGICMGSAKGPILFYTASVLMGIGNGIIFPCCVTCINNMVRPTRRGAANATYSSAIDVGIGSGIIFFGILSSYSGLRFSYFISALLYVLAYLLYLLFAQRHYFKNLIVDKELTESKLNSGSEENLNKKAVPVP